MQTSLENINALKDIVLGILKILYFLGSHVHSLAGLLQPEQTWSLIGLPHFLQGEHPHV